MSINCELVEQDEVITLDMPHETLEEVSIDDEYEDVDDTDSDESDYSNFQAITEMEGYNFTNLEYSNMYNIVISIVHLNLSYPDLRDTGTSFNWAKFFKFYLEIKEKS